MKTYAFGAFEEEIRLVPFSKKTWLAPFPNLTSTLRVNSDKIQFYQN